jgi:hypothetical protein
MSRRLAGLFTIIAFVVMSGTWLYRKWFNLPTMSDRDFFTRVFVVLIVYFAILGPFYAKLGISLIQEVLGERRTQEEERRYRARQIYETAVEGEPEGDEEA